MVAYNKFEDFVEALCIAEHVITTDSFELALTNAANAPVASNTILANLTVITYTNLNSPFVLTTSTASETSGTFTLLFADETISASGGAGNGFRYVCIFNQTTTTPDDNLMGWYDYGSDLALADGESLLVDWTTSTWTLV